jgi:uncharacterized protein YndB with AHSA1/START domain
MEKLIVEKDIWIAAMPERVWLAITSAEQMTDWWGDHWEIKELKRGGPMEYGREDNRKYMTIDALQINRTFSIRWPSPEEYGTAEVLTIFELEEEKSGTRIKVTETGFEGLPLNIRAFRIDSTADTYKRMLENLKRYIEGESVTV